MHRVEFDALPISFAEERRSTFMVASRTQRRALDFLAACSFGNNASRTHKTDVFASLHTDHAAATARLRADDDNDHEEEQQDEEEDRKKTDLPLLDSGATANESDEPYPIRGPTPSIDSVRKNRGSSIAREVHKAAPSRGVRMRGDLSVTHVSNVRDYPVLVMNKKRSRVFLSQNFGYPIGVTSTIAYAQDASKASSSLGFLSSRTRTQQQPQQKQAIQEDASKFGTSFAHCVCESWAHGPSNVAAKASWTGAQYDPEELDDPEMNHGKHRVVENLLGYRVSILPYTKKKTLKAELNELFRERHPQLNERMTLSKIRNLKREMLEIGMSSDLELATIAMSIAYFEKLIWRNVTSKKNRKVLSCVCVVLAAKFNDDASSKDKFDTLLNEMERVQADVERKDVFNSELYVLQHLNFSLMLPRKEYEPHLIRLCDQSNVDFARLSESENRRLALLLDAESGSNAFRRGSSTGNPSRAFET